MKVERPTIVGRQKSMVLFRAKSALGTKHFVAPEIVGLARKKLGVEDEAGLTEYVSSYALISDAYGVGATLGEI